MSPGSCKKNLPKNFSFTNHIYLIYMYKQDLALNKQVLICCKTQLMIFSKLFFSYNQCIVLVIFSNFLDELSTIIIK